MSTNFNKTATELCGGNSCFEITPPFISNISSFSAKKYLLKTVQTLKITLASVENCTFDCNKGEICSQITSLKHNFMDSKLIKSESLIISSNP